MALEFTFVRSTPECVTACSGLEVAGESGSRGFFSAEQIVIAVLHRALYN